MGYLNKNTLRNYERIDDGQAAINKENEKKIIQSAHNFLVEVLMQVSYPENF